MRNATADAAPFGHRPHTDAWNLITSICDYLDVAFSALTRIDGAITHLSFTESLNETRYEAGYGGLITFGAANRNGAERFRVLQPDSGCVLNYWGCMRSTTGWLSPEHHMDHEAVHPEAVRQAMEEQGHDHGAGTPSDGSDANPEGGAEMAEHQHGTHGQGQ